MSLRYIHIILTNSIILILLSACSTFSQIGILSADNSKLDERNVFVYSSHGMDVSYRFWAEGGFVKFTIANNSEKDIILDLSESFMINNGVAYDYFQNRTFGRSLSQGSSKAQSSRFRASYDVGVTESSYSESNSISRGRSVEYGEKKQVSIPAHSTKSFGEYPVASHLYRACGFARNPKRNKDVKVQFTDSTSPVVIENRLTFIIDGQKFPVCNLFYVSEVKNVRGDHQIHYKENGYYFDYDRRDIRVTGNDRHCSKDKTSDDNLSAETTYMKRRDSGMSNESATKESNSRLQSVTRNVEEGNILDLFESEKIKQEGDDRARQYVASFISEIKSDMEKALSEEDYGLIKRKINALESYNNNLDVPLLSTRQIIMSIRKRLAEKMRK